MLQITAEGLKYRKLKFDTQIEKNCQKANGKLNALTWVIPHEPTFSRQIKLLSLG